MIALSLLLVILLLAAGVGRLLLQALRAVPEDGLERYAISCALGLGAIAYLMLALGLLGLLQVGPVLLALALAGILCYRGFRLLILELRPGRAESAAQPEQTASRVEGQPSREPRAMRLFAIIGLGVVAALALLSCFVPPASHEWDALAYHLAAPKVFLQHERIVFLPTDHHSNFPFLVQMLFMLGLMLNGYPLANLFHFSMAAVTVLALIGIGRRHFTAGAGWIAALVFATAPIVVWEAGAAYIEHGMALYVLLALGAALEYRRSGSARWLALAGILMGFALGTKTLALVPAFALGAVLLFQRTGIKRLGWYAAATIAVGCPFYVKTWLWTGDPVYPFGYRIFGGRYWSDDLAQAYAGTQQSFGLRGSMLTAGEDARNIQPPAGKPPLSARIRNIIMAPFAMISVPRIFYDYYDPGMFTHLGFLFLALPPLLLVLPPQQRWSPAAALTLGATALWYVVWTQTMQYVRYIVPLVPFVGLLGGEGLIRTGRLWRVVAGLGAAAVLVQWGLTVHYFGREAPGKFSIATSDEARTDYLRRKLNQFHAVDWINRTTPREAGVVLFEETRGYYLDRPYLWGNYYHSRFIPYEEFSTARDMVDWFVRHGIRYALVNLQFSPMASSSEENRVRMREAAATNTEAGLMLEWYGPNATGGEKWRSFLGEAIREGAAVVVADASRRGVVVLELRPSQPGMSGNAMQTQAGRRL